MARPDWFEYYLGIADAVSKRGECARRQVGAVIVKGQTIVSTGYNGAPSGAPSCLKGACPRLYHDDVQAGTGYAASGCTVIHAEANAVIRAGRDRTLGATIFVTDPPCDMCIPLLKAAGIEKAIYPDPTGEYKYRVTEMIELPGVKVVFS